MWHVYFNVILNSSNDTSKKANVIDKLSQFDFTESNFFLPTELGKA
jgi:hypothetical protein